MKRLHLLAVLLAAAGILSGCQAPQAGSPPRSTVAQSTRDNSFCLLHQLLEEQKDVSMLRFIKREPSDVKLLVNRIAAASGAGAKLLEECARHDPSINLADSGLPSGEEATRKAIAATKKKELLLHTGDEFELALLLTQAEALSYAWHLAEVAGSNEPQPDRARALTSVRGNMERLYHELFALLLAKTK